MNTMIERQSTEYLKERQMNELLNWGWDNDIQEYREAVDIIAHEVKKRATLKIRMQYLLEALWIGTEFSRVPTNFDALKKVSTETIRPAKRHWKTLTGSITNSTTETMHRKSIAA